LLAIALSSFPVFASPNDDRGPGVFGRIERIFVKIARLVRGVVPQDDLSWPHP
jgi:hypothetical protein